MARKNKVETEWLKVDGRAVRCRIIRPISDDLPRTTLDAPLLLLHGLAGGADAWTRALECFAAQSLSQPIVAPDLPGSGKSPGPRAAMCIPELADWTARLLDELAWTRVHLAGHSMGCQIALALARRHPERVGALVLVGPTTGKRLMPAWRYGLGLANSFREPLGYKITATRLYFQTGLKRYIQTIACMLADDPLPALGEIHVPCLILRGAWDAIIPLSVARTLAAGLPRGKFLPVAKAAHVVQFSQPNSFTRLTLAFLAGSFKTPAL